MRIAVIGAGGVGGYFGARLAAAGEEVLFLARGAQKSAMERGGLKVRSALGDLHLSSVKVVERAEGEAPADLVLICVKLAATEAAIALAEPLMGPESAIASLQNGVEAEELLAGRFGRERVLGGIAHIAAALAEPGAIRHTGTLARVTLGELGGGVSRRVERFVAAFQAAGVETVASENVVLDIWRKFAFLAAFAGVTCFFRSSIGPILAEPEKARVFRRLVEEAVAVGRASGVPLPPEAEETLAGFATGLPGEMKSSMLLDLEQGRPLELEWLLGEVVRRGAELGSETPESRRVYEALLPFARGA